MSFDEGVVETQTNPKHGCKTTLPWTSYSLFQRFCEFRKQKRYSELIKFLTLHFSENVKNKTFNFLNTGHLFHSLYAYIPNTSDLIKERKQIRLSEECIEKLFCNTVNDFKLYSELFMLIVTDKTLQFECPCQLLFKRREEIKSYVANIQQKKFDSKPPKLKKELIDNIMYKYSLNWKTLLLKKKNTSRGCSTTTAPPSVKKRKKTRKKAIITDEIIYLDSYTMSEEQKNLLYNLNGLSLQTVCQHQFVVSEKQTRAGDEIVSFVRHCVLCNYVIPY